MLRFAVEIVPNPVPTIAEVTSTRVAKLSMLAIPSAANVDICETSNFPRVSKWSAVNESVELTIVVKSAAGLIALRPIKELDASTLE